MLLQQNSTMNIRPDSGSGKGKGVFAHTVCTQLSKYATCASANQPHLPTANRCQLQDIQDEQTILQEAPLVAGQHTSNKAFALVCSHCFQFLGSIRMQLAWCKLAALCNGMQYTYCPAVVRALCQQVYYCMYQSSCAMSQCK